MGPTLSPKAKKLFRAPLAPKLAVPCCHRLVWGGVSRGGCGGVGVRASSLTCKRLPWVCHRSSTRGCPDSVNVNHCTARLQTSCLASDASNEYRLACEAFQVRCSHVYNVQAGVSFVSVLPWPPPWSMRRIGSLRTTPTVPRTRGSHAQVQFSVPGAAYPAAGIHDRGLSLQGQVAGATCAMDNRITGSATTRLSPSILCTVKNAWDRKPRLRASKMIMSTTPQTQQQMLSSQTRPQ